MTVARATVQGKVLVLAKLVEEDFGRHEAPWHWAVLVNPEDTGQGRPWCRPPGGATSGFYRVSDRLDIRSDLVCGACWVGVMRASGREARKKMRELWGAMVAAIAKTPAKKVLAAHKGREVRKRGRR